MKLPSAFIKLPFKFDAERLAEEALQFSEADWTYHPLRHAGNTALALVSANGDVNDRYVGEMRSTSALTRCPYILQTMALFETVVGRSRLMRLAGGTDVPSHSDGHYSWRNRIRIHIPIVTHPDITFSSIGNIDVHMAAGEAWIFDNWRQHAVYNNSDTDRIHLVIDTVGTSRFWEIVEAGWDPSTPDEGWSGSIAYQPYIPKFKVPELHFERFNEAAVRPPDEIDNMLGELLDDLSNFREGNFELFEQVSTEVTRFKRDWRSHWALYGDVAEFISRYELLAKRLKAKLSLPLKNAIFDSNEASAYEVAAGWIAATTDIRLAKTRGAIEAKVAQDSTGTARSSVYELGLSLEEYVQEFNTPQFRSPIFIVAAPRSGSTMLFEALQKNKDLWTIGDESQREVESIPALHPQNRGYDSNRLSAEDYTPQTGALLMDAFMNRLQNAAGTNYHQTPQEFRPPSVRFLEKTPKNALRIPFFRQMFPDAKFIFLHRAAEQNIASMIDAWESQKFVTYARLPDWLGPQWSLLLPSGWRDMRHLSTPEIAAWQWAQTNAQIMQDLSVLPRADWTHLSYDALLHHPAETLRKICQFAEIPFGPKMQVTAEQGFPHSRYTLTAPNKEKWKRHEHDIAAAAPLYASVAETLSELE